MTAPASIQDHPIRGILLVNIALVSLSLTDVLFKTEIDHIALSIILLSRALTMALITATYFVVSNNTRLFRAERYSLLVLRGLLSVVTTGLFIYSLKHLQLAAATTISLLSPIFIALFSYRVLSERVGFARWTAVLIGFAAVMYILRPGGGLWSVSALLAVLSAVTYAWAMLVNRQLVASEHTSTIVFYFSFFSALMVLPLAVIDFNGIAIEDLLLLITIGIASTATQYFHVGAYRYARANTISAFEYMIVIYIAAAGFVFLGEVPNLQLIIGGAGLIACGLSFVYLETRQNASRHDSEPDRSPG